MNKTNVALLINLMEVQRKVGGFEFGIMPLAAQTAERLQKLFEAMGEDDILSIEQIAEVMPSEGKKVANK